MSRMLNAAQSRAVEKMVRNRGGLVWWKVGEGKSRIGLFSFAALQNVYGWNLPSICLIVCRPKAFYDWREEILRCFPGASVYENSIPVHPPGGMPVFLIVSYAKLSRAAEELHENKLIRFCILDELWLYANNKSARSKAVYTLTAGRRAVGLSGTVMKARDTEEIYCQAMAVHKHGYIAQSLTQFRTEFKKSKLIQTPGGKVFPRVTPRKGSYKRIMSALEDVADIHFPKGKRLIHEQYHTVPATSKQREMFAELRDCYSLDDLGLEYNHAIVIGVKIQQIANGWIQNSNGDYIHFDSYKIEKLEEELSDIVASGERAIVWCAFRHDVEMLSRRIKIASMQMLGGSDFDVARWNTGDARVCFATEASGSSVNHFEHTPYAIYFSANHKWLDMQQSRGRTDRKSSKHSQCFYKYLQVDGSLDAKVFGAAMESGRSESRLIMQAGVTDWLKK